MITTPTIHTSQHIPYAADASAQFLEDIGLRDGPPPFLTVAAVGGLAGVGCRATLVTKNQHEIHQRIIWEKGIATTGNQVDTNTKKNVLNKTINSIQIQKRLSHNRSKHIQRPKPILNYSPLARRNQEIEVEGRDVESRLYGCVPVSVAKHGL